ncbi:MAG TPA: hypothetical protein PLY90_09875, partial [Candidatus Hydrogenedentes bacterium]|nr:hypothetical protein [Candidatus Hydrogenedentota bacterium]
MLFRSKGTNSDSLLFLRAPAWERQSPHWQGRVWSLFLGGMSRGITPTQIQVPVFFLTRLYANAEIGVPREDLHFSG